jgi:hypothetical protein
MIMSVPAYSHIVVVVEENHNYDEIIGNTAQAPYINGLAAGGALLSNYDAVAHPSQPNYFALYAGSTFGTTDDNSHSEPDPTLYTILKGAGLTFTGYVDESGSDFNHDPWVSFPEGYSVQTDFGPGQTQTTFPALFPSGNYSSLPSVSFVIPGINNDMHNGTIQQGDSWLQSNLGAYAQWATTHNSLLVVVWDENDNEPSNQVPAILYGANVVPGVYNTAYNHYNLLSTILGAFNLTGPNNAATASTIDVFGGGTATTGSPTIADVSDVNGYVNAVHDTAAQALAGTAGANDTIMIYLNGGTTPAYTTQANASGNWSQTIGVLANATYSYTATATDAAGNVSAPSSPLTFTVDTTLPSAPTIADASVVNGNVDAVHDTAAQTLTGTAGANDTIMIYLNGGTTPAYTTQANASGNWSQTIGVLANATYSYTATATDAAGNVSAPSSPLAFTVNTSAGSPTTAVSFSGISDPTNTPPQNGLAVGPNYIVMAETSHFLVTDLKGNVNTAATGNGSLYSLFAPLGSTLDNNLLDARVVYDASTGRFVLIAENFQPGGGNFATNIDIAVSKDSNPADGWSFASIASSVSGTTQSDMPYLSASGGTIYLSGPQYLDAGGYNGTGEWVVNESSVAGSATIVPSASNTASSAYGIMRNVAGANGVTFYVSAYSSGTQTILGYQTFSTSGGFSAAQTIAVGDSDVGPGGNDYTAQQQGTSLTLDVGDSRIQSLAYANGYLWGVSEVKPSGATTPQILWFKLDVSNPAAPAVVLQGTISGAAIGTGVAVFNPSIAVDQNGDVLINFSASGPNMYPSDYYTVLGANASALSAPALYQASDTYFNSGSLTDQRWGIYSIAVADPNNANGFWLSNEYVSTAVTGPDSSPGWWDTVTAQALVGADAPSAPAEAPTLALSNASLTVQAGGSVPLGITATPVDSNDQLSVKISGVGEAATSAPQTIVVTDPPAIASSSPSILPLAGLLSPAYSTLAGLFDQYMAAESGRNSSGLSQTTWTASPQLGFGETEFLTRPHV